MRKGGPNRKVKDENTTYWCHALTARKIYRAKTCLIQGPNICVPGYTFNRTPVIWLTIRFIKRCESMKYTEHETA